MSPRIGKILNMIAMYGIVLIVVLILQTVLPLRIFGVKPNYALAAVVALALFEGPARGAVFGAILGFVLDCTAGELVGYFGLLLMLSGFLVGILSETALWRNLPAALAALGAVYGIVTVILVVWHCLVLLDPAAMLPYLWIYFVEFLLTAVVLIPAYFGARAASRRLMELE